MSDAEERAAAMRRALSKGKATTSDAATILGLHPTSVRYQIQTGKIPGISIGSRLFVTVEALKDLGVAFPSPQLLGVTPPPPIDSNLDNAGEYYD